MSLKKIHKEVVKHKELVYVIIISLIIITLLLFREKYSSQATILLVIYSVISGDLFKVWRHRDRKVFLILSSPFFAYLFGLIYTSDLVQGFDILSRKTSFLVFPIVLVTLGALNKKSVKTIKYAFVFSVLLGCIYCHYEIYQDWYKTNWEVAKLFTYYKFGYVYLSDKIGLHPTYHALYLIVSLLFVIEFFKSTFSLFIKTLWLLTIIYLSFFIIQIASRMGILVFGLLLIYYFFQLIRGRKNILIWLLSIGTFVLLIMFFKHNFVKKRFETFFENKKDETNEYTFSRNDAYRVFFENASDNLLIGAGTGDVERILDVKYKIENEDFKGYNFHNEYIEIYMALGILGLSLFVYSLYYSLKTAIKRKHWNHVLFIVTIMFFLLTESMLYRHKGMLFFALMNSLFMFNFRDNEKKILK